MSKAVLSTWPVHQNYKKFGACVHCLQKEFHDQACVVARSLDQNAREVGRIKGAAAAKYVAVDVAVMKGTERYAVARSHSFAKEIAEALNHRPKKGGAR